MPTFAKTGALKCQWNGWRTRTTTDAAVRPAVPRRGTMRSGVFSSRKAVAAVGAAVQGSQAAQRAAQVRFASSGFWKSPRRPLRFAGAAQR